MIATMLVVISSQFLPTSALRSCVEQRRGGNPSSRWSRWREVVVVREGLVAVVEVVE
jgi:hypothetical protein